MISLVILSMVQHYQDTRIVDAANCRASAELLEQLLPSMERDRSRGKAERKRFKRDRQTVAIVLTRYPKGAATPAAYRAAYQTPIDWTSDFLVKCASVPAAPAAD